MVPPLVFVGGKIASQKETNRPCGVIASEEKNVNLGDKIKFGENLCRGLFF